MEATNSEILLVLETAASPPPPKKLKTSASEPKDMSDVCVGTSVGTITEPECLGPCEPGTSVTLEGIVWHETEGGVLVVNVTWRGKTYVGTLLDCTRHDWAPPRFCDSPTSDLDARTPKGRGKRGRAAANATPGNDLSNFTETRSSVHSKLRNGGAKGRRGAQGSPAASPSPAAFVPPRPDPAAKREVLQNMFKNMDSLYTEISEFFSFDKQKYTIEEFFGDIKTFKDDFMQAQKEIIKMRETEEKQRRAREAREKAEAEKAARVARKIALVDMNAHETQEGVMDSLMEALQTGSAFSRPDQRRKRQTRAAGAERRAQLNRSRSRTGLVGTGLLGRELSTELISSA